MPRVYQIFVLYTPAVRSGRVKSVPDIQIIFLEGKINMGDKSPKSAQKQKNQKEAKANTANNAKNQAIAAKQVNGGKKK
jgi:hypothetical protein